MLQVIQRLKMAVSGCATERERRGGGGREGEGEGETKGESEGEREGERERGREGRASGAGWPIFQHDSSMRNLASICSSGIPNTKLASSRSHHHVERWNPHTAGVMSFLGKRLCVLWLEICFPSLYPALPSEMQISKQNAHKTCGPIINFTPVFDHRVAKFNVLILPRHLVVSPQLKRPWGVWGDTVVHCKNSVLQFSHI